MIIYGTQYYRPPYPAAEDWKSDLEKIKESNFNTVKLWAVWSWIERREGENFFADLDTLVDLCEQAGLQVVINTIPEGMPYWAARRHADARYRTHAGQPVELSGAANMPSGGSPGLCPDKGEVQELVCRFITTVVERYAHKENVIAFDVWNEPHIEPIWDYPDGLFCYCAHSITAFIDWLKTKYGSVEQLNRAWLRAYADWEDVLPPNRFGTYPDMIDWRRYWIENLGKWLEKRVTAAKAVARGKTVMTHVPFSGYIGGSGQGGLGQHLGDEFILAKKVDKFGVTSFPKWLMGNDFVQHLLNLELVASASASARKDFWQSELQAGAGKWEAFGKAVATAEEIRLWNWSAVACGAKGLLYWQWRPEPSGLEAPGFGLTTMDGDLSERTKAASECALVFNKVPGFCTAERIPAVNGIYVSRNSDLYLHAANQGERLYAGGLYGAYRACFERGIPVRMVHADEFQNTPPLNLQVLYAPVPLALSALEQAQLRKFVHEGGTLVMEACPGLFDEMGVLQRKLDFLEEVFGLSRPEVDHSDSIRIRSEAHDSAERESTAITGKYYRQDFGKIQPTVIRHAFFDDGRPAVFENRFGKGRAILIGSLPSLAVTLDHDPNSARFIAGWMNKKGYIQVRNLQNEGNILIRMHSNANRCYITASNYSLIDQSVCIDLHDRWQLQNDQDNAVLRDDHLEFRVQRRNGSILWLEK